MEKKLRQLDQKRETRETRKGCKNSTGSFRVGKSEQGFAERQRSNSGEFVPGQAFAERQRSNSGEFVAGQAFAERQRSNSGEFVPSQAFAERQRSNSSEFVPGQAFEQAAIGNMREFEKPRSEPWQFVPVPAQQHTNLPQSRRPCRILCFGDSNTAGFTDQGRSYYPYGETLSETLRAGGAVCDVGVCGLNGHSAKQMAAAMGESCVVDGYGRRGKGLARILDDDGPIDLVIIMTGTNDLARGAHAFDISNVTTILHRACHERGVPTIALAPPFGVTLQRGHQQVQMRKHFAELLAKQLETKDGLLAFF
jgi:lysophospholipase L1-like esterase